ncbi:hypothetical protein CLOM_g4273 [Closterium sp. NIES-68]|nr:hypothetical protein CLOM_g4273 [Closterium sp. NIES-68]GJP69712.1 hypothetical protein CLOP_g712 [Closterium sp. NIES-67]
MNGGGSCSLQFDPATATEFLKLQRVLMRQDASRATNADTLSWLFDAAKESIHELVERERKRIRMDTRTIAADTRDIIDILPAPVWHSIFRRLLLPPSHPDARAVVARRNRGNSRASSSQQQRGAVVLASPESTAGEQHRSNAESYGASWALLCCALASRRLLLHVLSFSASQPTALAFSDDSPQWSKSVLYLLRWAQHQLALTFTEPEQLRTLGRYIACSRPSLTSLALKLRGMVDGDEEQEYQRWTLDFLKDCSQLQQLKLGRGMWNLSSKCESAAWVKSLRSLTIKHVDCSSVDYQFLGTITPQLTEFTLYEHRHLAHGPRFGSTHLTFSFSSARILRFRFLHSELKLTLSLPPSLETLSVMAKWLVLACKSSAPLSLHHLSLYGQDRLVISSLRLASARVAYLNGPASDEDSTSPMISSQLPLAWQHLPKGKSTFSWSNWLRAIAPKVEVLIVRHGVPIEQVNAVWRSLRSLGIVVGTKGREDPDWEAAVERFCEYGEEEEEDYNEYGLYSEAVCYRGSGVHGWRGGINQRAMQQQQQQVLRPPSIKAPKLESIFFPTRKPCEPQILAALRRGFPSLALYCVIGSSYYWERKRKTLRDGPVVHVRHEKSGVLRSRFDKKHPKSVREKMHSVNGELVEGYSAGDDESHMLKYNG